MRTSGSRTTARHGSPERATRAARTSAHCASAAASRAEPVSSRTDSGSAPAAMCAAAASTSSVLLPGARTAEHADRAAQPRARARRPPAHVRRAAQRIGVGHVGMTPRGSDKFAGCWHHEPRDAAPPRAPLRPAGPAQVLAVHGLTGHGRRWRTLSHPPSGRRRGRRARSARPRPFVVGGAVDHRRQRRRTGRLLVENEADGPVVVVGHSFGGAVALHLAAAAPGSGGRSGAARSGGRPRRAVDARDRRRRCWRRRTTPTATRPAWRSHRLVGRGATRRAGRRTRRASGRAAQRPVRLADQRPAMMSYWSELARDIALPHKGTPHDAGARARWTDPPYVTEELIDGLRADSAPTSRWSTSTATTWWPRPSPPRPPR